MCEPGKDAAAPAPAVGGEDGKGPRKAGARRGVRKNRRGGRGGRSGRHDRGGDLDTELAMYQAEKEGKTPDQVRAELREAQKVRRAAALDDEMDDYFKSRDKTTAAPDAPAAATATDKPAAPAAAS